jgi:hypothetical protein
MRDIMPLYAPGAFSENGKAVGQMRLLIILTTILLTGCHIGLCTWDFGYKQLTDQPSRDRLVGEYKLIESSRNYLADKGFKKENSKLELLDNGQFKCTSGPDLIFDKGQSKNEFQNKEGKWSLSCADSYDCLIELDNVCVVPIAEKDGRLAILITIGDGDECNGVVYEKVD